MEINEKIVMTADGYDRIDGREAYRSRVRRLTLGWPGGEADKKTEPSIQLWEETEEGELKSTAEISVHRALDITLFLCRTLQYFREAYRLPLLYDPDNPSVDRLGLQGDAMTVKVCTGNPDINEDIQTFSQAVNDLGELTGERLRTLAHILEEMECFCNRA